MFSASTSPDPLTAPAPTPATALTAGAAPFDYTSAGGAPAHSAPAKAAPGGYAGDPLTPVLRAGRLVKTYGDHITGTRALDGVDLDIARADSLAIMGPSGCGKTTLLHVLAGILQPSSGAVDLDGTDLAALSDRRRTRLRRSDFGFVFQDGQLLPELTALENVILPRMLAGTSRRRAAATGAAWLDRLGLQGMHDRRPGQLSGGQAQRVAIARSLGGDPSVVFADEPTGALDQTTGQAVLDVLVQACHRSGASLVMVTHDPSVAAVCGRTVAMRDGRIEQEFHRPLPTQPQSGQSQPGQAQAGHPQAGQPQAGQPQAGLPRAEQSQLDHPGAGQPQVGGAR